MGAEFRFGGETRKMYEYYDRFRELSTYPGRSNTFVGVRGFES